MGERVQVHGRQYLTEFQACMDMSVLLLGDSMFDSVQLTRVLQTSVPVATPHG